MSSESKYIALIINKIEISLQWRPNSEWAEYDYKKLSELIFQKTSTLISSLTLRRIFNNAPGTYNPKQGTKEALARFAGYADWQDFIEKERLKPDTDDSIAAMPVTEEEVDVLMDEARKKDMNLVKLFIIGFLFIGFVILVYLFFAGSNNGKNDFSKIELSSDIEYSDLPFTACIHYDISGIRSGDVYLTYTYNGRVVKKLLDPKKHEINVSFELPGAYTLTMRHEEKNLKMIYITGISRGWYATYFNSKGHFGACVKEYTSPLDTFIYDTISDGWLYFSPAYMKSIGADITHPYFINHTLNSNFRLNGRNSTLEIRFRNSLREGGMSCQMCQLNLLGDTNYIHIALTNQKSYSYTFVNFCGEYFAGETTNLKSLGINMNEWAVVRIMYKNKKLIFFF